MMMIVVVVRTPLVKSLQSVSLIINSLSIHEVARPILQNSNIIYVLLCASLFSEAELSIISSSTITLPRRPNVRSVEALGVLEK